MSLDLRDIELGTTIDFKFTTVNTSGAPTTLAGSPVVSAYVDNSTTEITAGITLTVDFDSRTGLHHVRAVISAANGYTRKSRIQFVITAGTVGGSSVVGYEVANGSVEAGYRPGIIARGIAQSFTSTTIVLEAAESFEDDALKDQIAYVRDAATSGKGQAYYIAGNVKSTDTVTLDTAMTPLPVGTLYYELMAAPRRTVPPNVNVASFTAGALTNAAFAANALSLAKVNSDLITAIRVNLAVQSDVTTVDNNVLAVQLKVLKALIGADLWKIVENTGAGTIEIRLKSDNTLVASAPRVRSGSALNPVIQSGS